MAHNICRPLGSIDTKWHAMVWEDVRSLPFHAKHASTCWLQCDHYKSTKHRISVTVNYKTWGMGKSTNTSYWLIVQRGTRQQKSLLCAWPLVYNRAKLQWRTQRRKLCFFSIDDRLRIAISTEINTICNMSGQNVECGMSAGCISETGEAPLKQLRNITVLNALFQHINSNAFLIIIKF